ncbi:MAG: NAD(P)-dependent alcohol dehydrogenase [Bacteroidales bacterium]|nr:NAD(P)-dependent alcohol dehydrogenase [Bacteroidales bacterium]
MRAAVIKRYGAQDKFAIEDIDEPALQDDEILIKVEACSINLIDYEIKAGVFRFLTGFSFPMVLGCEVSGRIVNANKSKNFENCEMVMALTNPMLYNGGFAEYMKVKEKDIYMKPKNLSHAETASIIKGGLVALGLFEGQNLRNKHIMVYGCRNSVGSAIVQVAKQLGANVTCLCTYKNVDIAREIGADQIIDFTFSDLHKNTGKYNIVIDTVGNLTYQQVKHNLAKHAEFVTTLPDARLFMLSWFNFMFRQKFKVALAHAQKHYFKRLKELAEQGIIKPFINITMPLEEIDEALKLTINKRTRGKVVLKVGTEP